APVFLVLESRTSDRAPLTRAACDSLDANIGVLHDLAPLCSLDRDHRREFRRSIADRLRALSCQLLPYVGLRQRTGDFRLKSVADVIRWGRGCDAAVPPRQI